METVALGITAGVVEAFLWRVGKRYPGSIREKTGIVNTWMPGQPSVFLFCPCVMLISPLRLQEQGKHQQPQQAHNCNVPPGTVPGRGGVARHVFQSTGGALKPGTLGAIMF